MFNCHLNCRFFFSNLVSRRVHVLQFLFEKLLQFYITDVFNIKDWSLNLDLWPHIEFIKHEDAVGQDDNSRMK